MYSLVPIIIQIGYKCQCIHSNAIPDSHMLSWVPADLWIVCQSQHVKAKAKDNAEAKIIIQAPIHVYSCICQWNQSAYTRAAAQFTAQFTVHSSPFSYIVSNAARYTICIIDRAPYSLELLKGSSVSRSYSWKQCCYQNITQNAEALTQFRINSASNSNMTWHWCKWGINVEEAGVQVFSTNSYISP